LRGSNVNQIGSRTEVRASIYVSNVANSLEIEPSKIQKRSILKKEGGGRGEAIGIRFYVPF